MRQSSRQIPGLQRQVELRRSKLEVIPPFDFRVEIKRPCSQQCSWSGVGQIENELRRQQALVGIWRVADFEHLVALRERRGHATREIWTNRSARAPRSILEDRPVADKFVGRNTILVGIVHLRQTPYIMVAHVAVSSR